MPIEYEMMYLKRTVEEAINDFSKDSKVDGWLDNIERSVLHIIEDTPDASRFFTEYQITAMRELIKRGYWIKWDESIERTVLTRLNR
jgi:hypothetical protein